MDLKGLSKRIFRKKGVDMKPSKPVLNFLDWRDGNSVVPMAPFMVPYDKSDPVRICDLGAFFCEHYGMGLVYDPEPMREDDQGYIEWSDPEAPYCGDWTWTMGRAECFMCQLLDHTKHIDTIDLPQAMVVFGHRHIPEMLALTEFVDIVFRMYNCDRFMAIAPTRTRMLILGPECVSLERSTYDGQIELLEASQLPFSRNVFVVIKDCLSSIEFKDRILFSEMKTSFKPKVIGEGCNRPK